MKSSAVQDVKLYNFQETLVSDMVKGTKRCWHRAMNRRWTHPTIWRSGRFRGPQNRGILL